MLSLVSISTSAGEHERLWSNVNINGALFNSKHFKYILHSEVRIVDETNGFENFRASYTAGYQYLSNLSFWLGYQWESNNSFNGMREQNRIWEQIIWDVVNNDRINLFTRTRLEERFLTGESQINNRLRERVNLRFLNQTKSHIYPIIWDEIFVNLNNPSWVANRRIDQNRLFVGVDIFQNNDFFEVGYLNQHILGTARDVTNHILLLSLNVFI